MGAVALQVAGVGLVAASLGAVYQAAAYWEGGGRSFFGLLPSPSLTSGSVLAAVVLSLGGLGAASLYAAEQQIARLSVESQRSCREQLVRVFTEAEYRGWNGLAEGSQSRFAGRHLSHGARSLARLIRRILRGVVPVVVLLISGAGLIAVSPRLTLMLLPLGAFYLLPVVRLSRDAARFQAEHRRAQTEAREVERETLDGLFDPATPARDRQRAAAELASGDGWMDRAWLDFRRRLVRHRAELINRILVAACVAVLVAVHAASAPSSRFSWAGLLLYLVALRFAAGSLSQVTATLAVVSRQVPEAAGTVAFLEAAEQLRESRSEGETKVLVAQGGRT